MERLNLLLTKGPRLVYCNFSIKQMQKQPKKGTPVKCEYNIEIDVNNEKHEVNAALSVKSESENVPFKFDIKSEAKFECEGSCPSDEHAIIEAIPYIFSFLKEIVADLTAKAYFKPLHLPSLELKIGNFMEKE